MRAFATFCMIGLLAGCGGLSWDTRVAENMATRLAMIESVRVGDTTEMQYVGRWGNPLQKMRDGGRVDYIYRSRSGDPDKYVIVTFEHGVAIDVRSNETVGCRASFAPRIPGYSGDTPDVVKPIGWCANDGDTYVTNGVWKRMAAEANGAVQGMTGPARPGVPSDEYVRPPGSVK